MKISPDNNKLVQSLQGVAGNNFKMSTKLVSKFVSQVSIPGLEMIYDEYLIMKYRHVFG